MVEPERSRDALRLAAIVEGSEYPIIGYTLNGVITNWNQAATRLYGFSAEEAIGHDLSIIVPPARANELAEVLNTVAAGERIQQLETVRHRKDDGPVDVALSIAPIRSRDGTIIGCSSIVRDITSRKQMEEALRRSEERFRLVVHATKDAIWDLDIGSGKAWRSENFWEHFGYPAKATEPDVEGWKSLLHPEDRDRVWNAFQTALLRRSESYENEYRFRRADGSYSVVLDRAYLVYDESGKPTRAIGAVTDLSERRELEEQFRQAQKMEAVGQLAGGIAHDFNNCLMVISSYTELAQRPITQDLLHQYLAQVLSATQKAATLTHQLLALCLRDAISDPANSQSRSQAQG